MEQPAAAPPRQAAAAAEAAAAAAKKTPTTLLDAYEVECIRRELQRLVLKHNDLSVAGGDSDTAPGAHTHGRHNNAVGGHLHHHHRVNSAKAAFATRVSSSPSPSPSLTPLPPPVPKKDRRHGRGVRLLGRHAVAICGGSRTTAPVAGAPVVVGGRGKERAVAFCSGTTTAPVGVDGRRRRPRGGYREVEKV